MRSCTLAPAALLLTLFTLPAQPPDLTALTGPLSAKPGGGNAGDCQQQAKDLQTKIDAANAKNDILKVRAYESALEQVNKACNKIAEKQAKVDAKQQKQQAKAENNDAVKALGGLFK